SCLEKKAENRPASVSLANAVLRGVYRELVGREHPSIPPVQPLPEVTENVLAGWSRIALDEHDKAAGFLARALRMRPDDPLILDLMGECFVRRRQYGLAYTHFVKAVRLDPDNHEYLDHLAMVL